MTAAQEYARYLADAHPVPPTLHAVWSRDSEMVQNRAAWLAKSLTGRLRDVHDKAPILLLPTGQLNACAATVPNTPDQAVVLLELRITLAFEYLTELAFWSVLADDTDDTEKLTAVAQSFCDLYSLPILENRKLHCPDFVRGVGPEPAKLLILANCISFVISHEYAHVTEGHLLTARHRTLRLDANEIQIFTYSQLLELEADSVGMQRLVDAAPSDEGPLLCAPLLVCVFFGALDHIDKCLTEGARQAPTHPTGFQRFDALMDGFSDRLHKSAHSFAVRFHQVVLAALMYLERCDLAGIAECQQLLRGR